MIIYKFLQMLVNVLGFLWVLLIAIVAGKPSYHMSTSITLDDSYNKVAISDDYASVLFYRNDQQNVDAHGAYFNIFDQWRSFKQHPFQTKAVKNVQFLYQQSQFMLATKQSSFMLATNKDVKICKLSGSMQVFMNNTFWTDVRRISVTRSTVINKQFAGLLPNYATNPAFGCTQIKQDATFNRVQRKATDNIVQIRGVTNTSKIAFFSSGTDGNVTYFGQYNIQTNQFSQYIFDYYRWRMLDFQYGKSPIILFFIVNYFSNASNIHQAIHFLTQDHTYGSSDIVEGRQLLQLKLRGDFITAYDGSYTYIWSINGSQLAFVAKYQNILQSISVSPDGSQVFAIAKNNTKLVIVYRLCADNQFYDKGCNKCAFPCTSCQFSGSGCLTCAKKYYIRVPYYTCEHCLDQHCFQCDSIFCYTCDDGFYVTSDQLKCVACMAWCTKCINDTYCTRCDGNAHRVINPSNSSCICMDGYYLQSDTCKACLLGCIKCTDNIVCYQCNATAHWRINNASKCQCIPGFYQANNMCQPCLDGCINCTNSVECLQCNKSGHWQFGNTIQTKHKCVCMDTYYAQNGICKPCVFGCIQCTKLNQCQQCNTSQNRQPSPAHDECPCMPDYEQTESGICLFCNITGCLTCVKGAYRPVCTICDSSKHWQNSQGFCSCQRGYYRYGVDQCRICSSVVQHCSQCYNSAGVTCTACEQGYELDDNQCNDKVPAFFFILITTAIALVVIFIGITCYCKCRKPQVKLDDHPSIKPAVQPETGINCSQLRRSLVKQGEKQQDSASSGSSGRIVVHYQRQNASKGSEGQKKDMPI